MHPERQITWALLAAADPATQQQQEGSLAAAASPGGPQYAPCGDGSSDSSAPEQQLQQQQQQHCVAKRPGRLQTRPTFSLEDNQQEGLELLALEGGQRVANDSFTPARRRLLQAPGQTLATILQADLVWAQGFRGQGVKMGVFDTGIRGDHPDVKHIV
jgi:membrane-bound transcription factor site-1 protease